MKYQIIVTENTEIVPGPAGWNWGTRIGEDRDVERPDWNAYNEFRRKVIDNGGFDRYWGPLDSVYPAEINGSPDLRYAVGTFTFNTLEAVNEFYELIVNGDNPRYPGVYHVKIVEIEDDGTFVSLVKETNTIPFPT